MSLLTVLETNVVYALPGFEEERMAALFVKVTTPDILIRQGVFANEIGVEVIDLMDGMKKELPLFPFRRAIKPLALSEVGQMENLIMGIRAMGCFAFALPDGVHINSRWFNQLLSRTETKNTALAGNTHQNFAFVMSYQKGGIYARK